MTESVQCRQCSKEVPEALSAEGLCPQCLQENLPHTATPPTAKLLTLGDKAMEVAHHGHSEPESLGKQLHGDLDRITMKAIARDRTRR
jgi:hypothetical protein